jgi:hypothetical protein
MAAILHGTTVGKADFPPDELLPAKKIENGCRRSPTLHGWTDPQHVRYRLGANYNPRTRFDDHVESHVPTLDSLEHSEVHKNIGSTAAGLKRG